MEEIAKLLKKVFSANLRTTKTGREVIEIPCWNSKYNSIKVGTPAGSSLNIYIRPNEYKKEDRHPDFRIQISKKDGNSGGYNGSNNSYPAQPTQKKTEQYAQVFGPKNPCTEYTQYMKEYENKNLEEEVPF